jgi:hypothetical protein
MFSCANRRTAGNRLPVVMSGKDSNFIKQRELLKGYALCSCVSEAFKNDSAIHNDLSLSWYLELLLYPQNALLKIDSFAKACGSSILPSAYPDYKGRRAVLFLCTEFSKSEALDSLVRSLDGRIGGDGYNFFVD